MAITRGYATLAEVKAAIGKVGAGNDTHLETLVEAASRWIDELTGRHFDELEAQTRVFTADVADWLEVDDLVSVTTLKSDEDGDRVYETTWATTDYDLTPDNAAAYDKPYTAIETAPQGSYGFPTHRRGIQIVGSFGWPAVPPQVKEACILQVARWWKRKDAPFGITGSAELGQLRAITSLDPDVKQLLMALRRFRVGAI